ncbi:hypothetical protein [Providencia hangzhouensis]|uniref:hypothetical protein n=1 Tax=Providencia hangzhouensis TaxID=3031799 RepID=UPI00397D72BB
MQKKRYRYQIKECNFDEFSKDTEGKWVAVKDIKITFGGKNYVGTDKKFLVNYWYRFEYRYSNQRF